MRPLAACLVLLNSLPVFAEAVVWRDPGPIQSLDLTAGPGGAAKAPQPPFTFVSEDAEGTTPKISVKDAKGISWSVKFGEEVKAENFASRIAWAAGYFADPTYYVGEGTIQGVRDLKRTARFVEAGGKFRDARFELRDGSTKLLPGSKWSLNDPALKASRELAGLKTVLILVGNWDIKPGNMAVVQTSDAQLYAITDWGASMGRTADITGRSKWHCENYAAASKSLIEGVDNGFVVFNYDGKRSHEVLKGIKVEDVQWLMSRLGQLSDSQIDAALRGSGATAEEAACFAPAFKSRLGQLMTVGNSTTEGQSTIRTRREVKTTITTRPN